MRKDNFIVFLVLEIFFGLISIAMIFNEVGAMIYLYSAIVFAAVLSPFFMRLKKTEDEAGKRKIRRNIFLVMLIPIAAGVIAIALVVGVLLIGFAS